ncbi:MAG: serine/threonine protein kinase [Candidatus Eremiobacteraeota bacterium]|nr:serine/threonine protein kinase [Candidatus Eremiobacteraeota bacterium]
MKIDPKTEGFLKSVREEVKARSKTGLLSRLIGKATNEPSDGVLAGLQIQGYVLSDFLGQGAAGVVYSAVDKEGREVALKLLPLPPGTDKDSKALLEREGDIGQTIAHPAVVQTLETFDFGPAQCVVMELVRGAALFEEADLPLDIDTYLQFFRPFAEGLQAAHALGVVHRDLKPENVLRTAEGEVKILDFGMARRVQDVSVTATGTFKGTVRYASPEQICDSKRASHRADQFAFAMMSFEALTGTLPYEVDEKQFMITLTNRIQNRPKLLSEVAPHLPEAASPVMDKMLATEPEGRYESVQIGFEALAKALKP